jgi:hypothetical protein
MHVAQWYFVSKDNLAGQRDSDGPQRRAMRNNKSVQQMMRAAMKRARAASAMTMVMRMASD